MQRVPKTNKGKAYTFGFEKDGDPKDRGAEMKRMAEMDNQLIKMKPKCIQFCENIM